MNLVMTEHLCRDADSQSCNRDDWNTGFRSRQGILYKSSRKPNKELRSQLNITKLFSENSRAVVATETKAAESQQGSPLSGGVRVNSRIAKVFEKKERLDTRNDAVSTSTLIKLPRTNIDMMRIDSGHRPHVRIHMMPLSRTRKLETTVLVKLLGCTMSGTIGTETVRTRWGQEGHDQEMKKTVACGSWPRFFS